MKKTIVYPIVYFFHLKLEIYLLFQHSGVENIKQRNYLKKVIKNIHQ